MAFEWDCSGLGYPDKCISAEGFSFSNIIIKKKIQYCFLFPIL